MHTNGKTELNLAPARPPAAQRHGQRIGRRIGNAAVAGPLIGLALGAFIGVGLLGFTGQAFWATVSASTVSATILAILLATYSSLESPDPGNEPSEVDRRIADRPGCTRVESGADVARHIIERRSTYEGTRLSPARDRSQ